MGETVLKTKFPQLYCQVLNDSHVNVIQSLITNSGHTVVGFTTTFAISVYHHWSCEFESHSDEVYLIQHCVIEFVSDLR
jgi:hypothetical protein